MDFQKHYLDNTRFEFQRMKGLAERALEQIPGVDGFHFELDKASNSIAVLIQHLSGNMVSRWTDFLTSDVEKPNRHRDSEFEPNEERTRDELMEIWERGWSSLFESLNALSAEELNETVVIRGEEHTVVEAIPAADRARVVSHRATRVPCPACHHRGLAELEHPKRAIAGRARTLQDALTT